MIKTISYIIILSLLFTGCKDIQPCESSWNCSEWSECNNNQKTRECVDTNICGEIKRFEYSECTTNILEQELER